VVASSTCNWTVDASRLSSRSLTPSFSCCAFSATVQVSYSRGHVNWIAHTRNKLFEDRTQTNRYTELFTVPVDASMADYSSSGHGSGNREGCPDWALSPGRSLDLCVIAKSLIEARLRMVGLVAIPDENGKAELSLRCGICLARATAVSSCRGGSLHRDPGHGDRLALRGEFPLCLAPAVARVEAGPEPCAELLLLIGSVRGG
jgi:hypothetical protein